jgi:hypothetical protein
MVYLVLKRKEPQPRSREFKILKFPTPCSEQSEGGVSKASYYN